MPVNPGDYMPPLDGLENLVDDSIIELKHEAGFVYVLDFWATWCPPCQKPMAHNCEMIKKHNEAGDWPNVRIIGLSLDEDKATLDSHVHAKGLTAVTHYHVTGESTVTQEWEI